MKKYRLLVLFGLIILIVLIVILTVKDPVIKLGVIGDYSTNASMASIEAYRAIELAVEELNKNDIKYKLVRFNIADYSDIDLLKDDIVKNEVKIVIGPSTSGQFYQSISALESLDLPVFLLSVSADGVSDKEDNLFRLTDTLQIQVDTLLEASITHLGINKIQVYYSNENSAFSKPYAEAICEAINSKGGDAVKFEVGNLSDYEVQNLLLTSKDANGFVIIAGPGQAGIIADLLSKKNPDVSIIFPAWAKSDRTIEYTKNVKNDMFILSSPEPIRFNLHQAFEKNLMEEKNTSVTAFSYFAYEITYFIDHIIEDLNSSELKDIKDYIHNLDEYEGRFNDFTFNSYGDGGRGYSLMSIVDGKFILIE